MSKGFFNKFFKEFDLNNDGYISINEFAGSQIRTLLCLNGNSGDILYKEQLDSNSTKCVSIK